MTIDASMNIKNRKASPEAIALMMANKKKNDGNSLSMKRDSSRQGRKLFY